MSRWNRRQPPRKRCESWSPLKPTVISDLTHSVIGKTIHILIPMRMRLCFCVHKSPISRILQRFVYAATMNWINIAWPKNCPLSGLLPSRTPAIQPKATISATNTADSRLLHFHIKAKKMDCIIIRYRFLSFTTPMRSRKQSLHLL